jgi:hypothetical protein
MEKKASENIKNGVIKFDVVFKQIQAYKLMYVVEQKTKKTSASQILLEGSPIKSETQKNADTESAENSERSYLGLKKGFFG